MSLIEKLKLSKNLKGVIKSDFNDFTKKIENRTTLFKLEQADFLFNSKKELIGFVNQNEFKVRLNNKNNFLKINAYPTVAKGHLRKQENNILLECKITPFNILAKIYYTILILFLLLICLSLLSSDVSANEKAIGLGISLFFIIIGLVIPFFTMRKDVEKLYKYINDELINTAYNNGYN